MRPWKASEEAEDGPRMGGGISARKKGMGMGVRAWLLLDASGQAQVVEAGKHAIMRRTGLPARDLRILDPLLSYPSTILGRERAIVINLEHVKAIITAQEVLLLNSKDPAVAPFVANLQRRLPDYNTPGRQEGGNSDTEVDAAYKDNLRFPPIDVPSIPVSSVNHGELPQFQNLRESVFTEMPDIRRDGSRAEMTAFENGNGPKVLPFEFRALEACLETACSCLESEELLPIFNVHGKVSSIVFENERRDTAIIRYEAEPGEGDQLVGRIRESLHNTQLGDRTLLIEAFRSDSLLFIGNLTPDIDDAVLRKMFEPHGSIERAFVLHNAAGHSKGYGFVEYSLKSQAMAAKVAMGNINMDGRVLRVEWSDCKRIADMFSTVLFVDRVPKDHPNIEGSLRSLFGRYGKVRDCHLAIGINNLYRGFGFIDFYHSICADIAHESLDGHELEGHSIRVSFANPSKSAQSYKVRFGNQGSSGAFSHAGRGGFSGMMINSSMRGHMPMPLLGHRFMGPGRSGMLGMGIGMQFGRGPHVGQALIDQGIVGSGAGMLGAGAAAPGMMGRAPVLNSVPPRRGMAVGGTLAPLPRFPGQGPVPINPATIAQVATAQAKAREEEAKARAEEYHQQQPQQAADNLFKHSDAQYGYQQPYQQQTQQQSTLQPQYQQPAASQMQQSYTQYYAQPAQSYVQPQQQQQPQQGQYSQSSYYQQQPAQQEQAMPSQPYAYAQQYGQQYGQQYAQPGQQQYGQTYNPPAVQNSAQPYQQSAQTQVQTQYAQPAYTDHYTQQQQTQERQPQANPVAPATNAAGILPSQSQDGTQQQAYTSYYNQQAQQNVPQVATVAAQNSTAVGTSQQSLEAQWAAYYASQAAYQQQASYAQQQQPSLAASATSYHEQSAGTPDVGQKRTADQMEAGSQNQQMAYNYPQQTAGYPQQAATGAGTYQQQQPMPATAYQQHPPAAVPGYQMQTSALPYQQQPSATGYQKPGSAAVSSGYDKHVVPVADGYQQQQPAAVAAAFQPTAHGQLAAPIYDYSKRPRF